MSDEIEDPNHLVYADAFGGGQPITKPYVGRAFWTGTDHNPYHLTPAENDISWAGLMELLDEHSAARIISLLRWVDRDRAALARVESVCASITRDRAARRVEGVADLAVKDAIDTFAEAVRDAMLDVAAPFHAQHGQNVEITYTNPDSSEFGAKAALKAFVARSRFKR